MTITNWENNKSKPMSGYYAMLVEFKGYTPEILEVSKMLGKQLKAYREEHGFTQRQLAEDIGIGINTFRSIESKGGITLDRTKKKVQNFLNPILLLVM